MTPDQIPEKAFQTQLLDLCGWLGLRVYHTYDSRRSQRGFPDLVIVGPYGVLFRELKKVNGRTSADQQEWLDDLCSAGADATVWRPDQWDDIQDELKALAGRP